ncbi:type III secretion system inner membrane ring lipoprotein SctJ [Paraburkholderia megapolitana]|uniref:Lipoprotein n=1 Tax=Paraburkholderia megapolitana TaxID=420953 RepID=A0A1I3DS62_9BURK|nr:type III secretion inner membrane ring lipoprotein SctJ [Paraburkholderia megapolitana]QDQ79742.1 EscJ/YscJ/HrcJ family type III secretion inner membrane ring protein [Paraburkholderia megapolitana]SFH89542.1 type III secretion apparatus lipoprotein, YscJ/HrcJ family [Paraburkholderia megapolitana]
MTAHRSIRWRSHAARVALVGALVLLAGCQQELYSGLSEAEANQMLGVLTDAGISATKDNDARDASDRQSWLVEVPDDDMHSALTVLHANGLPRPHYASIGELFQKQGLVSTPAEERMRYLYGVSQDLSRTLQDIEGVVVARVQVVIPENDPLADKIRPSSAAVYIRYRPGVDLRAMAPMVKDLVAHSIEGLQYDNVSLFLQPASEKAVPVNGIGNALNDIVHLRTPLGWLVGALVLLTFAVIALSAARRGMFGAGLAGLLGSARSNGGAGGGGSGATGNGARAVRVVDSARDGA